MKLGLAAALLSFLFTATPRTASARPAALRQDAAPTEVRPAIGADQLEVTQYTPSVFAMENLRTAAVQLFGQQIGVLDPGGASQRNPNGVAYVPHFVVLGQMLLIRDNAEQAAVIKQTLEMLEKEEQTRQERRRAASEQQLEQLKRLGYVEIEGSQVKQSELATATLQLRARYISFEALRSVLQPFERPVMTADRGSMKNMNFIEDAGVILVRETTTRLAEIQEAVKQVDAPRPQIAVVVTLVAASPSLGSNDPAPKPSGGGLPTELVQNLRSLVPNSNFEPFATGMLRCTIGTAQQCELDANLAGGGKWTLTFIPDAYDPAGGAISLKHCRFTLSIPVAGAPATATPTTLFGQPQTAVPMNSQSFDTSLSIQTGEYVVLGGVGDKPIFVVIRATPVTKAQ